VSHLKSEDEQLDKIQAYIKQMGDLLRVLLLSFAMGILIYYSITFIQLDILKLIFGTLLGAIFFLSAAWLFNIGEIKSLPSFIRQK